MARPGEYCSHDPSCPCGWRSSYWRGVAAPASSAPLLLSPAATETEPAPLLRGAALLVRVGLTPPNRGALCFRGFLDPVLIRGSIATAGLMRLSRGGATRHPTTNPEPMTRADADKIRATSTLRPGRSSPCALRLPLVGTPRQRGTAAPGEASRTAPRGRGDTTTPACPALGPPAGYSGKQPPNPLSSLRMTGYGGGTPRSFSHFL